MAPTPVKADDASIWKRCSTCRGPIDFGTTYYVCSVSTCNRPRTTYRFCTVECWEEHLPLMRHREAWAVEETAPTQQAWAAQEASAAPPVVEAKRPTGELAKLDDGPAPAPAPASPKAPAVTGASPLDGEAPRRRIRVGSGPRPVAAPPTPTGAVSPDDVLVVVSRLKTYVRERFGMNTSDAVMEVLSDHLRGLCHRAADNARTDGRKTVMDRDFDFLRRRQG
jgi:hypothetical protein